jgi:hypothetical protein
MTRQRLWMLMVVCVYAGCASHPRSETQTVVSDVLREQDARENCKQSRFKYCQHDADEQARCACVRYEDVFGPAWGPLSQQGPVGQQ